MTKKVHIKTYGCQMNAYDSVRMAEAMAPEGYAETADLEAADLIVLNTCHIREKAAEKIYSDLGRLRLLRDRRRADGLSTMIAVAGCVAQAEGAEILRRAPVVDLVVGPQTYHRLPELVRRAEQSGAKIVLTEFPEEDKFAALPARTVPPLAHRLPHRPGRMRQVLQLLRRALYARRRIFPAGRRRDRRSAAPCRIRRARGDAAWPERQRL